jgi:hypothetical protein
MLVSCRLFASAAAATCNIHSQMCLSFRVLKQPKFMNIMPTKFIRNPNYSPDDRSLMSSFLDKERKMHWFLVAIEHLRRAMLCCRQVLLFLQPGIPDCGSEAANHDYAVRFCSMVAEQLERCLPFSTVASHLHLVMLMFTDAEVQEITNRHPLFIGEQNLLHWRSSARTIESDLQAKIHETDNQFQRALSLYEVAKPLVARFMCQPFPVYNSSGDEDS